MKGCFGAALVAVLVGGPAFAIAEERGAPTAAAVSGNPTPDASAPGAADAIVAKIRAAVVNHDLDYFDKHLVDWDGARARTQRLTLFQIRECFGRPIKSVELEVLKPNPAEPLVPEGYGTNLPVTHLLRITFDEKHAPEETPACVFMLSKEPNESFRMALVLPKGAPPK